MYPGLGKSRSGQLCKAGVIKGEEDRLRIDSAMIGMESVRTYQTASASFRRLVIRDYRGGGSDREKFKDTLSGESGEAAPREDRLKQTGNRAEDLHEERPERINGLQGENFADRDVLPDTKMEGETGGNAAAQWRSRYGIRPDYGSRWSDSDCVAEDLRQATLRYIFELLFATRRGRQREWLEEHRIASGSENREIPEDAIAESLMPKAGSTQSAGNLRVMSYRQEDWFFEQETTGFSTDGIVKTSDGREIRFRVDISMSRRFEQTFSRELEASRFSLCDPLVINLDVGSAQLSDQKFFFDLDADGTGEEISMLEKGSGYLALDRNGNGQIDDGSELFGTTGGDGFAELAEYDEDQNGWIDENDEIWSKLKIFTMDENGQKMLCRLDEKGVGAICLGNAGTEFALKGQRGNLNGIVRKTGIFLYENGMAGTIQHLDLAN